MDRDVPDLLEQLAADEDGTAARTAVCRSVSSRLRGAGERLWVAGYIIGDGRIAGTSPFGFGNDALVGIAAVAQIGGELGAGAVSLLDAENTYAAMALVRQLVEVQYLADAFAEDHEIAADWMRADGERRRSYWQPDQVRKRAGGKFLPMDYWRHCDLGGHPTRDGLPLLPAHGRRLPNAYWWADLAGHLVSIWRAVADAAERHVGQGTDWIDADGIVVDEAIDQWHRTDRFSAAIRDLDEVRRM